MRRKLAADELAAGLLMNERRTDSDRLGLEREHVRCASEAEANEEPGATALFVVLVFVYCLKQAYWHTVHVTPYSVQLHTMCKHKSISDEYTRHSVCVTKDALEEKRFDWNDHWRIERALAGGLRELLRDVRRRLFRTIPSAASVSGVRVRRREASGGGGEIVLVRSHVPIAERNVLRGLSARVARLTETRACSSSARGARLEG